MRVALRQKKLLKIFRYSSDYLTVKYLAENLNVSERTIHNDLKVLEEKGNIFEKKPGIGIRLLSTSEEDEENIEQYSPEYRRNRIIKELLFEGKKMTYQSMAEKFIVSVSSIIADLEYLKKDILNDQTVKLVGDENGTRFVGTEAQWQRTMISFNEYLTEKFDMNFRDKNSRKILYDFYDPEYVEKCYKVVSSFREHKIYYVADYYVANIFNVLLVLLQRLSQNHHHTMEHNEFYSDQIMKLMDYTIAKELLEFATQDTTITFESNDVYFFSVYLNVNRITFQVMASDYGKSYEKRVKNMINEMSDCVKVNLTQDHELYDHLCLHLMPMIHRLERKIFIKNPMLQAIKEEYSLMFELTWIVADKFVNEYGLKITDDEVGFLMLYFQNSLEKQRKSKRILVVCPNGIATSTLISNKIRRVLPPLDIIEVASLEDVNTFEYSNIDFIVSTIPLEVKEITVVVVSTLLSEKDIEKIENVYKQELQVLSDEDEKIGWSELSRYLDSDHIFYNSDEITKEEIIQRVCQKLQAEGIVKQNFHSSVLEREKKGATDNIFGGAIPHGAVKSVNKTCLAVWVNRKPVKWTKYKVKVIVFFVLAEEDMKMSKNILENGFSFIKSKETIEQISSLGSKDELIAYIRRNRL